MDIILILIIIISLLAMLYIKIYNNIAIEKTKIEKVESIIDNDLRTKYDIISKIDDIISKNIKTNKDYLKDYRNIKNQELSNFNIDRILKETENIIKNLYDDEKELQKNDSLKESLRDLYEIDEKITSGIIYYNNHTSILNEYIRKIPNNFVAITHNIKPKPFFDGKDMTDDNIFDFKI